MIKVELQTLFDSLKRAGRFPDIPKIIIYDVLMHWGIYMKDQGLYQEQGNYLLGLENILPNLRMLMNALET